jgi:hypothetical protein
MRDGGLNDRNIIVFARSIANRCSGHDEISDGNAERFQHSIEAFDAESAAAVEKVGDVRLLESSLARENGSRKNAGVDALANDLAHRFFELGNEHGGKAFRVTKLFLKLIAN